MFLASHKDFMGGQVQIDAIMVDGRKAIVVVSKPYYEAIDQYSANVYSEIYSVSLSGSVKLFSGDTNERPKLKKTNARFYFEDVGEKCQAKSACRKVAHWLDVMGPKE